jgi:hypothetical protein
LRLEYSRTDRSFHVTVRGGKLVIKAYHSFSDTHLDVTYIVPCSFHLRDNDLVEWLPWLCGERLEPWESGRAFLFWVKDPEGVHDSWKLWRVLKHKLPREQAQEIETRRKQFINLESYFRAEHD